MIFPSMTKQVKEMQIMGHNWNLICLESVISDTRTRLPTNRHYDALRTTIDLWLAT